jgi:hypothetical protein
VTTFITDENYETEGAKEILPRHENGYRLPGSSGCNLAE